MKFLPGKHAWHWIFLSCVFLKKIVCNGIFWLLIKYSIAFYIHLERKLRIVSSCNIYSRSLQNRVMNVFSDELIVTKTITFFLLGLKDYVMVNYSSFQIECWFEDFCVSCNFY
jgi:hypothetical protein